MNGCRVALGALAIFFFVGCESTQSKIDEQGATVGAINGEGDGAGQPGAKNEPQAPSPTSGRDDSVAEKKEDKAKSVAPSDIAAAPQEPAAKDNDEGFFAGPQKPQLGAPAPPPPPPSPAERLRNQQALGGLGKGRRAGSGEAEEEQAPAAQKALLPIDPNGRFATTYRPGGGHLAAFESAVARGILPEAEREVVSDIGARYAAKIAAPTDEAVMAHTDFERAKLPPTGGPFHVRISLRSTEAQPTERPKLAVHLVMDTSGSMRGQPMIQARDAAQAMVDKLAPTDVFSLVTFSSTAEVLVDQGAVGPRRDQIKTTIANIKPGGGTNIGGGLSLSYMEATADTAPKDAVKVVMLLSDGRANAGVTDPDRLSKMALDAFQSGIQTSSFGLGTDYDGPLMSSIADEGAGGYYYLRDPEQILPALATELDKRLDPVATAVELRVRLKDGVDLLKVYGSKRLSTAEAAVVRTQELAADQQAQQRDGIETDREDDVEGGMRFFIPAFARDESHAILLQLNVPAGVGQKELALVELKYKDRVSKKNYVDEFPVKMEFANSDAASFASRNDSVVRTVQGFEAGETLAEAAQLIAIGNHNTAISVLSEREAILRQAAGVLREPLFLRDADRLARLRSHASPGGGMNDPLVLAMLMETAGRTHMR